MGEMRILTSYNLDGIAQLPSHMIQKRSGDTKVIWDPKREVEVKAARAQFDMLIKDGYKAYEVDKEGNKTKKIVKRFDKLLGKLIMVPAIAGG